MKVAIPTNAPGGLEAGRSGHFGHCDVFTVIEMSPGFEITDVSTITNEGHEAGGCMAPVSLLQQAGVEAIVVEGLGKRPMQGFSQAGITVYFANQEQAPDVKSILLNMRDNKLIIMQPDQVCQGSGNCNH